MAKHWVWELLMVIFSIYIGAVQFNPGNYPQLLQSINVVFTISAIYRRL
ncbi:hypothetical protein [Methanobacterium sp.]